MLLSLVNMDALKIYVMPFLSVMIPIALGYWCAKKTNLPVGLLTVGMYYGLITHFTVELMEISLPLATLLLSGLQYLTPVFQMLEGMILFVTGLIGLDETFIEIIVENNELGLGELVGGIAGSGSAGLFVAGMGHVIVFGIFWVLFLVLGILSNKFKGVKIFTAILCWILGGILIYILISLLGDNSPETYGAFLHLFR